MLQTEMHLEGRQLEVIARRTSSGKVLYDIPKLHAGVMPLEVMQKVLGELLDDIFALAYVSVDGEAYCSPLIREFEEAGKNAHGAFADGADGD